MLLQFSFLSTSCQFGIIILLSLHVTSPKEAVTSLASSSLSSEMPSISKFSDSALAQEKYTSP